MLYRLFLDRYLGLLDDEVRDEWKRADVFLVAVMLAVGSLLSVLGAVGVLFTWRVYQLVFHNVIVFSY